MTIAKEELELCVKFVEIKTIEMSDLTIELQVAIASNSEPMTVRTITKKISKLSNLISGNCAMIEEIVKG